MKRLVLVGLMLGLAVLLGPKISGGGSSTPQGASLPKMFVSQDSRWPDAAIKAVYNIEPSDNYAKAPWPFTASRVYFACAPGALTVVAVGEKYAALNGHTSGLAERYRIRNDRGDTHRYVQTSNNEDWRRNGIVSSTASDADIGDWTWTLNQRLLKDCAR